MKYSKMFWMFVLVLLSAAPVFGQDFIRGDIDADGRLDLSDFVHYIQALNDPDLFRLECWDTADVNDDGRITIEDPMYIESALFAQGDLPPAPFPEPGPDPTPDPIACDHFDVLPPEPDQDYVLAFPAYEITPDQESVSVELIFESGISNIHSCSAAVRYPPEHLSVVNVEQVAFDDAVFAFEDHGDGLLTIINHATLQNEQGSVPPGPMVRIEFAVRNVEEGLVLPLDFLPWSEHSPYALLYTYTGVGADGRFIPATAMAGAINVAKGEEEFIRGDVNGDQTVDVSDSVLLLRWLYASEDRPACFDAADVDDDGNITYADVLFLNRHLFLAGDPIPAPFPEADADPTDDGITCTEYAWPDNVNPVEPLVRISFEGAAGFPGDTVRVPVKLRNLVPLKAITLIFKWDPAQLSFFGITREDDTVIPEIQDADTFTRDIMANQGDGVVRIGFERTLGFVNSVEPNTEENILGYAIFEILDGIGDEPFAFVDIPFRLCKGNDSCLYTSAVGENGEIIQMRPLPITISKLEQTDGGGIKAVQKTVVPVDGIEDEPLAEVTAVSEFNTETGEGTLTFPELPGIIERRAKDDPDRFPFCFFPAQVGSSLLRSIAFVHGFALPGTGNLASLTDANSILMQIIEEYPIEDPRDKRSPFNPLGHSKIFLEMSTQSPIIKSFTMDLSALDWEKLPCPPAPFTFEWSGLDSQSAILTEHTGDYYLGWERVLPSGTTQSFHSFKRLSTKCYPVFGSFDTIPDQVVMVGGNYDPDNGAVQFMTAIIENDHKQFVRGDANTSGVVDLADPIHILDYLFNQVDLQGLPDAADANDDGAIDLSDAVILLMYTMSTQHTDMLMAPYWGMSPYTVEKGMDPTDDNL